MNTPICDFVQKYAAANGARFHMPGHKGKALLGFEALDITEIDGADNLFAPNGVIAESEANASALFGCKTLYSTGGSTNCIQAMLYLIALHARANGRAPYVLAARNVHKAFVNACALLDIDIGWLYPGDGAYHTCVLTPQRIEAALRDAAVQGKTPAAVYLTSPDYLGNLQDIAGISAVCKRHGVLLCIDNAHGAYLRFLPQSRHPIDLGADLCCDSAHKTLPALTGAAYLHIGGDAPALFSERAISALALFASTSPSYLILQSLDAVNADLSEFQSQLSAFLPAVDRLRETLVQRGFALIGDEPLKLTFAAKSAGYTGAALAAILSHDGIYPEFYDPDFLVLMLSPRNGAHDLERLASALSAIEKRPAIQGALPPLPRPRRILSVREAIFQAGEVLPVAQCLGRICAETAISCPPAVPIIVCGEEIDAAAIECFQYYNIKTCRIAGSARFQQLPQAQRA